MNRRKKLCFFILSMMVVLAITCIGYAAVDQGTSYAQISGGVSYDAVTKIYTATATVINTSSITRRIEFVLEECNSQTFNPTITSAFAIISGNVSPYLYLNNQGQLTKAHARAVAYVYNSTSQYSGYAEIARKILL